MRLSLFVDCSLSPSWSDQHDLALMVTPNESTVLIYSENPRPYDARLDVFDGRTYAFVNRFNRQGYCSAVIALPAR